MTEQTFSGTGTLVHVTNGTTIGGRRRYELRLRPEYLKLPDGELLESTPSLSGRVQVDPIEERMVVFAEGTFRLIGERLTLEFNFGEIRDGWGAIDPAGNLQITPSAKA